MDSRVLATVAAVLAFLGPTAAPGAEEPKARAQPPGAEAAAGTAEPPPGSPGDQALWRAGIDAGHRITLERLTANKMQWQSRQNRYDARLEAMAKTPDAPGAGRAAELLAAYRQALAHNYRTLTRQWPVDPTRGCQYQVMHFESILNERKPRANQVQIVRGELQDCVDRARPAAQVMATSNAELRKLIAEAEALLPAPGAAKPPARGAAAGGAPAPTSGK